MQEKSFIFSNKLSYRIGRHISFWAVFLLSQAAVTLIIPSFFGRTNSERLFEATYGQLIYLPGQLLLVYTLLYFLLPRFILKAKYKLGFLWLIILCLVTGTITGFTYWLVADDLLRWYFGIREHFMEKRGLTINFQVGFINGLKGALIVAGFAVSIKFMKYWYEKEYWNTILQKEKLNAELQSLKAQVHPHFLFNTLNNIYSITQDTAPLASQMIGKLSELLRYILYECNHPFVKLSQEFKLIEDYIDLESIRYNKEMDINISLPELSERYYITPLLLLPMVENCFKHGASKVLEQPWVHVQAELKDNWLHIKLINGQPINSGSDTFNYGIGLSNVKKRLELLYPGKHELNIVSEADVFIVNLRMELSTTPVNS